MYVYVPDHDGGGFFLFQKQNSYLTKTVTWQIIKLMPYCHKMNFSVFVSCNCEMSRDYSQQAMYMYVVCMYMYVLTAVYQFVLLNSIVWTTWS